VELVGAGYVQRTVGIAEIGAHRIAERAVGARHRRKSAASRVVATRAIGFARGEIAAVVGAVLARCEHDIELETTAKLRRFIPDRVADPGAELDAIVTTGIAHDDCVIAPHAGERIKRHRRVLVGRVRLADLDGAPHRRGKPDEAVSAEQGAINLVAQVAVGLFVARCR